MKTATLRSAIVETLLNNNWVAAVFDKTWQSARWNKRQVSLARRMIEEGLVVIIAVTVNGFGIHVRRLQKFSPIHINVFALDGPRYHGMVHRHAAFASAHVASGDPDQITIGSHNYWLAGGSLGGQVCAVGQFWPNVLDSVVHWTRSQTPRPWTEPTFVWPPPGVPWPPEKEEEVAEEEPEEEGPPEPEFYDPIPRRKFEF